MAHAVMESRHSRGHTCDGNGGAQSVSPAAQTGQAHDQTDVGPIPRQLLTRVDNFFGVLFVLTLPDELTRRQVPQ